MNVSKSARPGEVSWAVMKPVPDPSSSDDTAITPDVLSTSTGVSNPVTANNLNLVEWEENICHFCSG